MAVKVILIGGALFIASVQDVRSREVSDKIWCIAIPVGILLTFIEGALTPNYPHLLALLSGAFSIGLAFIIYYAGLYGGADAKALVAIAVTIPLPPYGYLSSSPFFPLTVLGNGIILSLFLVPACLLWNAYSCLRGMDLFSGIDASRWEKLIAIFIGIRVKTATANSVHFNVMERVKENGTKGLKFIRKVVDDEGASEGGKNIPGKELRSISGDKEEEEGKMENYNMENREEDLCELNVSDARKPNNLDNYVWVTPAIPMIVFLFAGFVLYFFIGDFVFRISISFW